VLMVVMEGLPAMLFMPLRAQFALLQI